jgi:hypothetical protein
MGMYQVQNYGKDFTESFVGMANHLSNQRKAESDLKQRETDNARQARMDEQSARVSDAQIAASEASTEKNVFDLEKSKREEVDKKHLETIMTTVSRYTPGKYDTVGPIELSPEELKSFSNASLRMSNMPKNIINPEARSRFLSDNSKLLQGYSLLDKMAASDQLYTAKRGDDEDIDAVLAAKERLMPKNMFTKTHTNKEYGEYSLANLEQVGVISDAGTARTADWFSIKDKDGNPIYEKDAKGNVITVPDPATGEMVPKKVLVPSTFGHTNDPNSKVKFDPSGLEQAKGQLGVQLLNLYERITPQQQQEIQDNNIAELRGSSNPIARTFIKEFDARQKPALREVSQGVKVFDEKTGKVVFENPKAASSEYKSRTRQEGTSEIFEESQDGGRTWKKVSSGPKFNPRKEGNGDNNQAAKDIAAQLRAAQRAHQSALKTGDPDATNEAIDAIESLNESAKKYKVTPLPLPARPFTSAENDTIKAQAVKNLEAQRGRAAKVFGVSPSVPAINQEIRRLKQTVKPGKVSFGDPQAQPAKATSAATVPPAGQHAGRIIKDTETGKRFKSDGSRWVEVR